MKNIDIRFGQMKQTNARLLTAIQRIAIQPVVRTSRPGGAEGAAQPAQPGQQPGRHGGVNPTPKLTKNPKNLFEVWHEYEFGINNQKPCKDWLPSERGPSASAYSRRLVFWQAVEQLVKRDHTSDTAIDSIYSHYGRLPVNAILLKMRADRKAKAEPFFHHLR
jgi:hypothetical protein